MAVRAVCLLIAAAAVLAGCGLLPTPGAITGFQGGSSCGLMTQGACQEQTDLAGARHPDATMVVVACTAPVCDRMGGAGTVEVTLASGAKIKETFSYTGDPAPVPVPACSGMAIDVCRSLANSTVAVLPPSNSIKAISIACTASSCTEDRGEVDVRVQFSDGSEYRVSQGWEPA